MGHIQKLDLFTSNRIAAGEVVERPASVAKELIENALDAGATSISVEIEDGGIRLLRVTDNGSGMDGEDAALSFERHATSKVSRAEDLDHIATLGFRGEALSSIAAVAQVEMQTRLRGAEYGVCVQMSAGELIEIGPIGCPDGTSILVENLFFQTPVRREFLKKPALEAGAVGDIVARYLLANPLVSFKFSNDGKAIYHSPGDGDLKSAIYCVYGKETVEALRQVDGQDDEINASLRGYVTRSDAARSNRRAQSFFVNRRYVQSASLSLALQEAFGTRLMGGRFPLAVLFLDLPYETVDVNVHPHKTEIRFRQEAELLAFVKRTVEASLLEKEAVVWHVAEESDETDSLRSTMTRVEPEQLPFSQKNDNTTVETSAKIDAATAKPQGDREGSTEADTVAPAVATISQQSGIPVIDDHALRNTNYLDGSESVMAIGSVREEASAAQQTVFFEDDDITAPIRIIGQAFTTYIIAEKNSDLYLVDQHAAHERMIYEEMVEKTDYGQRQTLLMPYEVILESEAYALLEAERNTFQKMGFTWKTEDGQLIEILTLPRLFEEAETADFLFEAIEAIRNWPDRSAADLKKLSLATYACKHAIRSQDLLNEDQMSALLARFDELGEWNCPHGRPIVLKVTRKELDKRFRRIV